MYVLYCSPSLSHIYVWRSGVTRLKLPSSIGYTAKRATRHTNSLFVPLKMVSNHELKSCLQREISDTVECTQNKEQTEDRGGLQFERRAQLKSYLSVHPTLKSQCATICGVNLWNSLDLKLN